MTLKDIYINEAISRICDGSKSVDKLNIKSENDIIIAAFKTDKGYKVAELTKKEITDRVDSQNIEISQIKDFIISLVREKLITGFVVDASDNIKKDLEKYITINKTVNNILDMLFPDK